MAKELKLGDFSGISERRSVAGRFSDHNQSISLFLRRSRALSGPRTLAAFPSKGELRSGVRECRDIAHRMYLSTLESTHRETSVE